MQRDDAQAAGTTDRERRERLESLQAELRGVKRQLEDVAGSTDVAVRELEAAVARAKARRDEARARRRELEAGVEAAKARRKHLEAELKEARVLALGATRRDRYVEWASERHGQVHGPDPTVWLFAVLLGGLAVFLVAVMINGCLH